MSDTYRYDLRRFELQPREEQVLFALADGLDNREIGEELHISAETVKTYMKRVLRVMGARNRTHAVALAYHHGILVPKTRP